MVDEPKTKSNLMLRILLGFIVGIISLTCLIMGGYPLMLLLLVFMFIGSKEYVGILKHKGFFPNFTFILLVSSLIVILVACKLTNFIVPVMVFATILAFMVVLFRGKQPYIANVASNVLGVAYLSLPCYIILIRQLNYSGRGLTSVPLNDGLGFLILLFFAVLGTDVGAYFIGKNFGKHLLSPIISPKKTIEGSIGGGLFAVLFALIVGYFIDLAWYHSLIVAILITVFAQLGDLAESMLKRDAGVKDSGNSIPGHGGFMDRSDSYMFTAAIAFYYFNYCVVNNDIFKDLLSLLGKVLNVFGA